MSRMYGLVAIAAGCAVSLTAVNADAAIVLRNATGQAATDFHIEFDGPVDKLKVTSSTFGAGVNYPPPSPKQNQIDFGGAGSVANGAELTLHGLRLVKVGGKGVAVTSWYWTGPAKLTGEPLIKTGRDTYTNLQELQARNLRIAAVPEPTAWALMILGFGAVGAMLRDRRAQMASAVRRFA